MKTKCFTIISLLFITFAVKSNNYIWLHGLNDDSFCWFIYQNAFTPSNSNRVGYACDKSIENISSGIWDSEKNRFNGNSTILIGHSMGGLVARELEFNHSASIKGIITMGTPHQGAPVLKELYNGGAHDLTIKIVNKAKKSVIASLAALCYTIPGIGYVLPVAIPEGIDGLVTFVGLPIINNALNKQISKNYNAQCTKDMCSGSTYMNKIATRKVKVPILTFACQEDRWQLARLGYCTSYHAALQTDDQINANGTFDVSGYNKLKSLNSTFKTVGGVHAGIAAACAVGGFFCPYLWGASATHGYASASWYSTAGYIDDGLDYDHAILVGASHVEKIKHRILFVKWYEYVTKADPHDGVVPVNSQLLPTEQGTNVIHATSTIKGVNHMEEFNHRNTREEFRKLITEGSYRPDIFKK